MSRLPAERTLTILNTASVSNALRMDMFQKRPRGINLDLPAAWTAADIGFQTSEDNITWADYEDAPGNRVKITGIATAQATTRQGPAELWGLGAHRYVRVESINTSTEAPVAQGADRAIKLRFYE